MSLTSSQDDSNTVSNERLSLPAYYTAPPGAPGTELKLLDILGGAWTPLGNETISEVSARPLQGLREDAGGKWNAATAGTRVG